MGRHNITFKRERERLKENHDCYFSLTFGPVLRAIFSLHNIFSSSSIIPIVSRRRKREKDERDSIYFVRKDS